MILNNYKKILYGMEQWSAINKDSSTGNANDVEFRLPPLYFHSMSNTTLNGTYLIFYQRTTSKWMNPLKDTWQVYVGAGRRAVSPDDYELESQISNVSNLSFSRSENLNENCDSVITLTITGIASADIEINEIGVSAELCRTTASSYANNTAVLIIREVLDETLVVPQGKGFRIVLEIVKNITE